MITILAMYTKDCEDLILTGLEKDEEMRYTGVELYEPSGKKFDITEYFDVDEYEENPFYNPFYTEDRSRSQFFNFKMWNP